MSAKKATCKSVGGDPWPYVGPIARADGEGPYNMFLLPLPGDSWWANYELGTLIDPRWHFDVVALADGRFSTVGQVTAIERGTDSHGRQVVFPDRIAAVRAAAARMIRQARDSRDWGPMSGKLEGALLAMVINWASDVVARESGRPRPRSAKVAAPAPTTA